MIHGVLFNRGDGHSGIICRCINNSLITSGKVFREYLNICNETLCSINLWIGNMFKSINSSSVCARYGE